MNDKKDTSLLIIDLQNDFCTGGSLEVKGNERVVLNIQKHLISHINDYKNVIFTMDWHINPISHFSTTPDYKNTWPKHCVANTKGATIHKELLSFTKNKNAQIFLKGEYSAAYSGFDGHLADNSTTLIEYLEEKKQRNLIICGLAFDYCVKETVMDALKYNFNVSILINCTAAISSIEYEKLFKKFNSLGVKFITS